MQTNRLRYDLANSVFSISSKLTEVFITIFQQNVNISILHLEQPKFFCIIIRKCIFLQNFMFRFYGILFIQKKPFLYFNQANKRRTLKCRLLFFSNTYILYLICNERCMYYMSQIYLKNIFFFAKRPVDGLLILMRVLNKK